MISLYVECNDQILLFFTQYQNIGGLKDIKRRLLGLLKSQQKGLTPKICYFSIRLVNVHNLCPLCLNNFLVRKKTLMDKWQKNPPKWRNIFESIFLGTGVLLGKT